MLAIKEESGGWQIWHIGDPTPKDLGRVVLMQADGDELNLILQAMYISSGSNKLLTYTKNEGFNCYCSLEKA